MKAEETVESRFLKACEYIELGEVCSAKFLLDGIVMDEPAYARAHYLLGWIYHFVLADYKRAEKHLKLCKKFEPSFPHSYKVYAETLTVQDKMEELMILAKDALKIPGIDRAYMFYKMAQAKEARESYAEAIHFINKSIKYSTDAEWIKIISKEKSRITRKFGFFRQIAALF